MWTLALTLASFVTGAVVTNHGIPGPSRCPVIVPDHCFLLPARKQQQSPRHPFSQ